MLMHANPYTSQRQTATTIMPYCDVLAASNKALYMTAPHIGTATFLGLIMASALCMPGHTHTHIRICRYAPVETPMWYHHQLLHKDLFGTAPGLDAPSTTLKYNAVRQYLQDLQPAATLAETAAAS